MSNVIQYVTIASTGNGTDFGDLLSSNRDFCGTSSTTRGLFMGHGDSGTTNRIQYITIASLGDAIDFGDLTVGRSLSGSAVSSATRAVCGGGKNGSTVLNTLEYVTIASTGNATDFGDLVYPRQDHAAASSKITGVFGGGRISSGGVSNSATIDAITIASTGNATDFGDLTSAYGHAQRGLSNSHGGIS